VYSESTIFVAIIFLHKLERNIIAIFIRSLPTILPSQNIFLKMGTLSGTSLRVALSPKKAIASDACHMTRRLVDAGITNSDRLVLTRFAPSLSAHY
jgi:hypothetical protein